MVIEMAYFLRLMRIQKSGLYCQFTVQDIRLRVILSPCSIESFEGAIAFPVDVFLFASRAHLTLLQAQFITLKDDV